MWFEWMMSMQFIWLKWNKSIEEWKEIKITETTYEFIWYDWNESLWVKWSMYDWNELWLEIDLVSMNDIPGIKTLYVKF